MKLSRKAKNIIFMGVFLVTVCLILLFTVGGTLGSSYKWTYVVESSQSDKTTYTASLKYTGDASYFVKKESSVIQHLDFTYFFTAPEHLVIKITDKERQRWEVPNHHPFPHADYSKKLSLDEGLATVTVTENPFSFKITRKKTNEVIFDSSAGEFIYTDYYLQISTSLATPNLYGLGERAYKLNLGPDGTYSIFNKDLPFKMETGESGNNLYGYHPVYLLREKSNFFSSALLRSSVPMDVVVEGGKTLTYKVIGGIMDFQFFLGTAESAKPETIIKQYHTYLGGWILQPFWSFGFHQCRWGYKNVYQMENVLEGYKKNNLPLDVIWSDIDYMDRKIDFTIDKWNFPDDKMNNMLTNYNKRWVPIIDAGVAVNNEIHKIGDKNNVYIKDPDGQNLRGTVWPGPVNFPDFFNPNTSLFWDIGLNILHKKVPYSGIWLDMNEVSNFVPGELNWNNNGHILNNPPYKPVKQGEELFTMTIRMDAVHHGGIEEYYVHNMFGFLESKATHNYLKTISDLSFILTRASFYGSGKYAAHWTGDNVASYEFMQVSIPTIINSGIFGMPMAGADICGFAGDTTEELCSRWMQLGVLYPFARNHNKDDGRPQEPYAFGETLLETSRVTLAFRYSMLRHYYTLFLKQGGTGTIFRPLFFEYPEDETIYRPELKITDNQFFIGESLMAAPALEKGQTIVSVYFPKDTWFDFVTGKLIRSWKNDASIVRRPAPLKAATAPIFIRGGHIIATQDVKGVMRTDDLSNVYILNIAFNYDKNRNIQTSQGSLAGIANFEDGNILTKCRMSNCLYSIKAEINLEDLKYKTTVTFNTEGPAANYETIKVSQLILMGDFGASSTYFNNSMTSNVGGAVKVEAVSNNLIKYTFEQPFEVKPNAKIEISGKRSSHGLRPRGTETINE